ncbi:hypothetical protein FOCC_FOCC016748, partial [Frankliniella occidentalis]
MALLGICDSQYKFTYVDIGARGSRHDAGVWRECSLARAMENGRLPIPPPRLLPGGLTATPHMLVGDDAYPLGKHMMKPFEARRTIENAFGIMTARWRILRRPFIASRRTAKAIIKACVVLHNMLVLNEENLPPHQRWYVRPRRDIPELPEMPRETFEQENEDA